ncbi:MAG TPA: hypothetical protein DCM87_08685 [Planctomycetes bacterium]|nr:hypothetical protein [Planctomycetota bacterium]
MIRMMTTPTGSSTGRYAPGMRHGHEKADARNLALHRLALEKLQRDPSQVAKVFELLDRWSAMPHLKRQAPLLGAWRRLLELPPVQWEAMILSDESQQLRQCSPLGVLITAQERFAVYRDLMRS